MKYKVGDKLKHNHYENSFIEIEEEHPATNEYKYRLYVGGSDFGEGIASDRILMEGSWVLIEQQMPGCEHDPVDVGFHFTKLVCKKCDCVLPFNK